MKTVHNQLKQKMDKTIEALKFEFTTIRAGKANPQMLDKIRVDYYGTPTPIPSFFDAVDFYLASFLYCIIFLQICQEYFAAGKIPADTVF